MGGAELARLSGRVQRVGLQEQAGDQSRLFGDEERRLTTAIGMAAKKEAATATLLQHGQRGAEPSSIADRADRRRRATRARLRERQIAAEDGDAARRKCIRHRDEQRGLRVPSGAMGQNEAVGTPRGVEIPTYRRLASDFDALDHA